MKITYYILEKPVMVEIDGGYIRMEIDSQKFIFRETLNQGELRIEKTDSELNMTEKGHNYIVIQ